MLSGYRTLPLAAALLLALPQANAGWNVTTAFDNVTWTVVDLTPGDGAAAGFVPVSDAHYRQARTEVFSVTPLQQVVDFHSTMDDAVALDSTSAFGAGRASAHADPAYRAGRVSAYADATLGVNGDAAANVSGGFHFTLLPHTRLEISGSALWSVLHEGGGDTGLLRGQAYFQAGELAGDDPTPPIHFQVSQYGGTGIGDIAGAQDFTLVYLNETDSALATNFYLSLNAAVTSAVPEPSGIALLAGGLAAIAARARRRAPGGPTT